MLPDYIDQSDARRNGERLVYSWFSNDEIPGTVYYSLLQKNHKHKLIGEIDFLYVCERGFLCIEVKGGQGIYCQDKKWHSINRLGIDNEIHNPFVQAKDCRYALQSFFTDVYGKNSPQSQYLFGYAVIFPECKFTGHGNDLFTEVMYDNSYDLNEFPKFLNDTFDFWEKQEMQKHNCRPLKLSQEQLRQANDLLRGDFHVVPSMHLTFQNVEQKMIQLTEEQYEILDIVEDNPRVVIQGAAGTGKSLLALQMVRKYAAMEKQVLYLCFNKNMADYAKASLDSSEYISVSTYHHLLINELNISMKSYVDITVLNDLYSQKCSEPTQKYDAIVVDEGQDLFCLSTFDVLNSFLNGGMEDSSWIFFMDSNQNIFNSQKEYQETFEYMRELYHPTIQKLNTNCRNTAQIARKTTALTAVPPVKHMKLDGPNVLTRVFETENECVKLIKKEITSLLASGESQKDIIFLSPVRHENSVLRNVDKICNFPIVESTGFSDYNKNVLNYFTVQSFKGLESKIVLYIDINGFLSTENRMINYVGMTRSKIQLYLFFKDDLLDEYESAAELGSELL